MIIIIHLPVIIYNIEIYQVDKIFLGFKFVITIQDITLHEINNIL